MSSALRVPADERRGPPQDPALAREGLRKCADQMKVYDACIEKLIGKQGLRFFRVQDEYRKDGVDG